MEVDREDAEELARYAKELGFEEVGLIPAGEVVVERRIVAKCLTCENYGRRWSCPPFVPKPEEFKEILKEFDWAVIAKLKGDPEDWKGSKRRSLELLLQLERKAYELGQPVFLGLRAGMCDLCGECTAPHAPCLNRRSMRFPPEAVGVNLLETSKKAGINLSFSPQSADPIVILLV